MLRPVPRRSLPEAVYEQLRDRILDGTWPPGRTVPAERALVEALGVNRGAVREALRRLEQAGLVEVRHGGSSRVLDFRRHAGLGLLPEWIRASGERTDPRLVGSVMEMRSALAPDVARLAARRGGAATADRLRECLAALTAAGDDLERRQDRVTAFWDALVDGADNLAYRLAFNALRDAHTAFRHVLAAWLAPEIADTAPYEALAAAVSAGDETAAARLAESLVRRGEAAVKEALEKAS